MKESKSQATQSPEDTLDFKKIMPIFLVVLIDLLGLTIIIPLLPLYAATFGADPTMIGLLGAAYPVMQFIGAPILGRLSDRWGRKPVLIASQIGTLIGFLMLGFANSLLLLFVSRLMDGLSGANIATAQAMIADSTTEKTRAQGLGLIGAAFGLGFIIGPMIAFISLALSGNNFHIPAFVAALCSAVSIVVSWFYLEETHKTPSGSAADERAFSLKAFTKLVRYPGLGLLFVLAFTQQIAFGGFEQILPLFTLNRLGLNASGNAVIFVFVGVVVVMVQGYFIGKWSRRFGDRRLIFLGLATLAIGLFLTTFTPSQPPPWYDKAQITKELTTQTTGTTTLTDTLAIGLPDDVNKGLWGIGWLLVVMVPAGIGGGVLQPSINSMLTKRVGANERGGILGISAALISGANAVAPVMGGILFQVNSGLPFIVWGAILAILFGLAWTLLKPETSHNGGVRQAAPTAEQE
jgi:DHA1 family tetracycline resistance protein-like MFS transporter